MISNKIRVLVYSFLLTTPALTAPQPIDKSHPNVLLSCWDSTFSYNMFTIQETERHYFVTIIGSSLVERGKSFVLRNSFQAHDLGDYSPGNRTRPLVIAAIKKEECEWDPAAKSLRCRSGRQELPWDQYIFLAKDFDHLGERVTVISRFSAPELVVTADGESGLSLIRTSTYEENVTRDSLQVRKHDHSSGETPLLCGLSPDMHLGAYLKAFVPADLVSYLEQ